MYWAECSRTSWASSKPASSKSRVRPEAARIRGGTMDKAEMIEAIEKMTVLELADLVKALEEKFGVKAAVAAGPAVAAAPVAAAAAAPDEEQSEFTVMLKD